MNSFLSSAKHMMNSMIVDSSVLGSSGAANKDPLAAKIFQKIIKSPSVVNLGRSKSNSRSHVIDLA